MGNQPPVLSFSQGGAKITGPPAKVAATLTARPVSRCRPQWVEDPKPEGESESASPARGKMAGIATAVVPQVSGPGTVTFDKAAFPRRSRARWWSHATFETAGDYMLRVQANDESGEGGGGFQCCWTNTYVKVTVQ